MGEDNSNGQSHINPLDHHDKFLNGIFQQQPPNYFSFQSVQQQHSSTMPYNNNVFPSTSTLGSSSTSLSYDERHGKMLKSNSSNSIISQDVGSHIPSSAPPPSSTFILSFENSTVEPALHDHGPNSPKHFGGEATCSSLLSSERTLTSNHNNVTKPKAKKGNKKLRSSSEIQDHIMAERKRRQELTERFIALSATIPGLKKVSATIPKIIFHKS
ncbi:Transcription factor bHLH25, partial [Mucuna pruriens]